MDRITAAPLVATVRCMAALKMRVLITSQKALDGINPEYLSVRLSPQILTLCSNYSTTQVSFVRL
jgi:hypothetical protein